jgi:TATA-binding protein-associated factor Taf7
MADIDAIERLLCERYNVRELAAGELSASLAQARAGDLQPLRAALDARELYRWRIPVYAALKVTTEVEQAAEAEGFESLKIADLRVYAADHDIDLGDARLKADIVAAIEEAESEEREEPDEEGDFAPED